MLSLHIEQRDAKMSTNALRKEGKLPAVFYGRKEESTPIVLDAEGFRKAWKEAGESTIISLEGVGDAKEALIHDVDVHPVKDVPQHVDFYVIEKGKKLQVGVTLDFVGVAPAIKSLNGTLVKVMHEVEIEALPKDLPHSIEVDISKLVDFETHITIKDLNLPEGVEALADPDETVVLVSPPKEIVEEEEPTDVDMDAIEVEKKGKAEEEEGGEGESKDKE